MPKPRSRLALVAAVLGLDAVTIGGLGVALAYLGVVRPMVGFALFAFGGALLGIVAVVVSGLALRATREAAGLGGRGLAWIGLVSGGAMLLLVLRGASAGQGLPRINDITTDPNDPPQFEYATRDPATRERDWSYPAGFAEQQRAGYPDLAPIALPVPPAEAASRVETAMKSLGMEVTNVDPARGLVEGREVSKLFRFVDDVTVRIRPSADGGSVIDLRSKSRDGRGDLGANANRIRRIAAQLAAKS